MRDEVEVSINGCARCHGEGHVGLIFQPLTHPVEFPGVDILPLTHWTRCPVTGEPILLRIEIRDLEAS